MQQLHRALVTCGAPIDAMNAVRKHVSAVKGGRLAAAAGRATKITLAVSDVPAGKESALASGPTLPDPTTIADMRRVLRNIRCAKKLPPALSRWLGDRENAGDAQSGRRGILQFAFFAAAWNG